MKGLELAKAYFEECGRPVFEGQFANLMPYLAFGLFGSGSECFGFDDELSRDHDFEPGFMVLLPGEDLVSRRDAFLLERAYAKLPKSFEGFERQPVSPVGGDRHGVLRYADVFMNSTGTPDGSLTQAAWLTLPGYALAEAVNGEIFLDNYGEVTRIRKSLAGWPEEVRFKKLAGHLLLMAQAGQYNYPRCIARGETGAAQLAAVKFAESAMEAAFLFADRYMPYYKWSFRALKGLPVFEGLAEKLEYLISTGNDPDTAEEKAGLIETVASCFIDELQDRGWTKADCGDLEKHAYSVNDRIADAQLRNRHILAAV